MRSDILTVALLLITSTPAFAHPQYIHEGELIARDNDFEQRDVSWDNVARDDLAYVESVIEQRDLFKRKGGGGGGGKGGGGSSSSGKGGSGSSSGSSGSSSSSGRGSSSSGRGSSSSSIGGSTKTGSGPTPRFGGGRYYGGGATTPYAAGRTSPLGIPPVVLLGVGAAAIFPGLWLYGAYSYPYHNPYTFRNHSANATNTTRELQTRQTDLSGVNETKPVTCLCAQYAECGCDDSGNTTVLDELIGDGSYDSLNKTLVNVVDIKGNSTIVINGTLPNGTTASGGSDDANLAGMRMIAQSSGYWVMVAIVAATCWMI
ncbi:hypothetical protein ACMFMF_009570 [Clarireedia jacksonii]